MAETTYTYLITDTANDVVDTPSLKASIQEMSQITISLNRIDTDADEIFIVFNDELPTGQINHLTDIVNEHTGIPLQTAQPVRIQETNVSDRQIVVTGLRFVADLNDTTNGDISFSEDREVQGADVYVENHTSGDYVEMFAVHPIAGVVAQFAETVYVPAHGRIDQPPSFDTKTFPAGLIVRFTYTSVATTGPQPIVIVHMRAHK